MKFSLLLIPYIFPLSVFAHSKSTATVTVTTISPPEIEEVEVETKTLTMKLFSRDCDFSNQRTFLFCKIQIPIDAVRLVTRPTYIVKDDDKVFGVNVAALLVDTVIEGYVTIDFIFRPHKDSGYVIVKPKALTYPIDEDALTTYAENYIDSLKSFKIKVEVEK